MNEQLRAVAEGQTLSRAAAEEAMHLLMRGESDPDLIAAFLIGIRARGETVDELVGFTRVMREYAVAVDLDDPHAIDVCGTGGDGSGTFNISTAAALVCAGAGVQVAKHGNRSISSKCGSADVLEALGVRVDLEKAGVERCLKEAGIAFIFAPLFHPAMKHVMPVRRKLGVRTFFNILGPLCNPAGVRRQLVGAFSEETARVIAAILSELDADHVISVHSADGLDEISLAGESMLFEFERRNPANGNGARGRTISPEDHRLRRARVEDLTGGDARHNADLIRRVLTGEPGPRRDVVVLNAAYALSTSGKFDSLDNCLTAARESIDHGAASGVLQKLITASRNAPATA